MDDTLVLKVRSVETRRMPGYVHQYYVRQCDNTVCVFRNQPERIELQLRSSKLYSTASLSVADAQAIVKALQQGIEALQRAEARSE